jgi:hypothetical protein
MVFEEMVQEWVRVDNQIRLLQEKMQQLRERKQTLQDALWKDESRPVIGTVIPITDGKLKFVTTRVQQPLTFHYLNRILREIIQQEDKVQQIVEYVKKKREIKEIPEIKRVCSKNN